MCRRFFFILFIIACEHAAPAQEQSFSPQQLAQASTYAWTGENGLISNNITSSIQASSGFIWITTYNGIMRFDGKDVEVYDRSTLPFLNTDAFYRVYEDKAGTLWFASQGSGIVRYSNHTFEPFRQKDLPKSTRSLFFDRESKIWVGSNNEGLYLIDGDSITSILPEVFKNTSIYDITRFGESICIATENDGLFLLTGNQLKQFTKQNGLPNNSVNAVGISGKGTLLIGTSNGLCEMEGESLRPLDFLANSRVNSIVTDSRGRTWIANENGLGRIDYKTNSFEFVAESDDRPFARINYISFDREGSAWLSTGRSGLVQLKETGIVNITTGNGLSMNRINVIYEGGDKTFYIGTDDGRVNIYKDGKIKTLTIKTDLNLAGIRDIHIDDQNQIWIASYRGILRINKSGEKLLADDSGLPANDMRRIIGDGQGNLWVASRSAGLVVLKNEKVIKTYTRENGLNSNYILALERDSRGYIYVGTHSGGMTIIKPDGSFENFPVTDNDSGVLIFNIHISTDGSVWLATNIGLMYFNGKKFTPIKLDRTKKGETFFDWLEDKDRNVWVTSNVGVIRILKSDLDKYMNRELSAIPTKLIDNQDGMRNKECTGATHSTVSSSGKLWIPTINGVSVIYPERIQENKIVPPVYVTRLETDKATHIDSAIVQPGNLRYTFRFTALSYISPSKVNFKYKLDDVDPEWVTSETKRFAEYTNLSPGSYTFRVIAANNDGMWNTQGSELHFVVKPFFYQTLVFYIGCAAGIILIFYLIYRWRLRVVEQSNEELRKVNSELDRFVYSASHDLRAPLASVLGLVTVARLDKNGPVFDYLDKIEKSVQRLDQFIHDIIDYSRNARTEISVDPIDFKVLVFDVIDDLKYLDEKGKITYTVNVEGEGTFFSDRRRLTIILRNLISNAFKYYNPNIENPFIKIEIKFARHGADITIADNGIGIATEHIQNVFKMFYRGNESNKGSGLGLYIVKETVQKIKGTVNVQSRLEKGTTFHVHLPNLATLRYSTN